MKIAQVVCVFPPYQSGIGNVAKQYAEIAFRAGHESYVLTPRYKKRGEYTSDSIKMIYLRPLAAHGNGAFVPQIISKMRDFDIVHLHYPFYGSAELVWLAKMIGWQKFRLAIQYHMDVSGLSFFSRVLSAPDAVVRNRLFNIADQISCASIDYIKASRIKKSFYKQEKKFMEIPFAVDNTIFKPSTEGKSKRTKILFVGGLDKAHYFKGVDILLSALEEIESSDWELAIVGEGDMRLRYQKQARDLGLGERVNFVGSISGSELVKHYQSAGLFVFPSISRNEAFGMVLLEAMACGLPIIASRLNGVRMVFTDGKEGLFVEPNNSGLLAEKIQYLIDRPELREKMSRQGIALVERKYNIAAMEKKLISMYENMLNK